MKIKNIATFGMIAILAVFMLLVTGCTTYSTAPGSTNQPVTTVTAGCGYQPTVAVAGNDVVTLATATPTTVNYIVNGEYRGTSAPAVKEGNNWRIVADLTGYLAVEDSKDIPCGATTFAEKLYAYANATVTIKDDPVSSSNTLTNGGGANNATKASAGGYRQFPIIFQGTAQKSTGNIFWVIETPANMAVNTSSIVATVNGVQLSPVSIPNGITAANAASYRTAFVVPALVGATSSTGTLTITNTATGVVSGLVKNTFYAQQKFVDASGTVQEGIMDSSPNGNNAAKYQDTYTYNIVLQ